MNDPASTQTTDREQETEARRLADRLWNVMEPNDMIVRRQASRLLREQEERLAQAERELADLREGYGLQYEALGRYQARERERTENYATVLRELADCHARWRIVADALAATEADLERFRSRAREGTP